MFLFIIIILLMLMFSGGGYYGHRRGYYGPRMAYGGIGITWILILVGMIFLMPHWGFMGR
jgi:hypothetical protein